MELENSSQPAKLWIAAAMTAIVAVGALIYSNSLQVPFLLDDSIRIVNNEDIRTLWPDAMRSTNRPFSTYTFSLNYAVHGYDVRGYHIVNLLIHLVNGLLVFQIFRELFRTGRTHRELGNPSTTQQLALSFLIALIWVAHPIQTSAVTYIVQRLEILMATCLLACILGFLRSQRSSRSSAWLTLSVVAAAVGMGCKEVMALAPIVIFAIDYFLIADGLKSQLRKRGLYYLALAATWLVLAWAMLHYTKDYAGGSLVNVKGLTPWSYLFNQSAVILHYLGLMFWPAQLCFYYQWEILPLDQLLLQVAAISILIVSGLVVFMRSRAIGFWWLFTFLLLAPTSSIVPIKDLAFEHRMYLPSIGVIAVVVIVVFRLVSLYRERLPWLSAVPYMLSLGAVVGLSMRTYVRNQDYQTEIGLWEVTVKQCPHLADGWHNLGLLYRSQGEFDKARQAFKKATEVAPTSAGALAEYGAFLLEHSELDEAGKILFRAREVDPSNIHANFNLAAYFYAKGDLDTAIASYRNVLNVDSKNEGSLNGITRCLLDLGEFSKCETAARKAVAEIPNSAIAWVNLACCLQAQDKNADAISACQKALDIDSKLANAHGTLAILILDRQRDSAIEHMELACRLDDSGIYHRTLAQWYLTDDPLRAIGCLEHFANKFRDDVESRILLVDCYERTNQLEKAVQLLTEVVKLVPDWTALEQHLRKLKDRLAETKRQ